MFSLNVYFCNQDMFLMLGVFSYIGLTWNNTVALLTFSYNCLAQLLVFFFFLGSQMPLPALPCNCSFFTKCRTGIGRISACGGDGFAGGGGGRVSLDIFSRHDEPEIFAYGKAMFILHV